MGEVLLKSKKEEKKEDEAEKVKLAIPAPKEDQASNQDFLAVLDSIGNGSSVKTKDSEKGDGGNVESINDLFCIDKTGADDEKEEDVKPPPVKQLKRRNASMYASNDE